MNKKKGQNISWEQLQSMGNPENAPEMPKDKPKGADIFIADSTIRIHLEKKGRGGKSVSIIRGLKMTNAMMKDIEKALKSHCGVGGSQKNGEIIIQGDQRDKIMKYLQSRGAKNIKKAGA
ncbi:MAG: translation initiation factor [Saprospiraceae bacterium]|nr:translation initiation factor [Bacteroidia bacterium]NNE16748.1 translation initiation factor [Saprospiraceae bacterium]